MPRNEAEGASGSRNRYFAVIGSFKKKGVDQDFVLTKNIFDYPMAPPPDYIGSPLPEGAL